MQILHDKPLVEGLGFEGVLTVYDETPRMYRRLGKPRTDPRFPLWYYYDEGGLAVTVRAEYDGGRFRILSIRYDSDPKRRIATGQGIRLGDPLRRVLDAYGEPDEIRRHQRDGRVAASDFVYRSRGVTLQVGPNSTVLAITVFRPVFDKPSGPPPKVPDGPGRPQPEVAPAPTAPQVTVTLATLGLALELGPGWRPRAPLGPAGGAFETDDRQLSLELVACEGCRERIGRLVDLMESHLPPNAVPEALRRPAGAALAPFGADAARIGLYLDARGRLRTWLLLMHVGERTVLLTLHCRTPALDQVGAARAAAVLGAARMLPGAPPP